MELPFEILDEPLIKSQRDKLNKNIQEKIKIM